MKTVIFAVMVSVVFYFISTYGYYHYLEDAYPDRVFFEKKSFTLQMRFYNIFANQSDHMPLGTLMAEQREKVVGYCKYRLGIVTELTAQGELDRCKYGDRPSQFRSLPMRVAD